MATTLRDLSVGLIVTVAGGVAVAWIIQDGRFQPKDAPPLVPDSLSTHFTPGADVEPSTPLPDFAYVARFLDQANQAEMAAFQLGDPTPVSTFYEGEALGALHSAVEQLNYQGYRRQPVLLSGQVVSVRNAEREGEIYVDTCETWASTTYHSLSGTFVGSEPARLVPKTLRIRLQSQPKIVGAAFHAGRAFCP